MARQRQTEFALPSDGVEVVGMPCREQPARRTVVDAGQRLEPGRRQSVAAAPERLDPGAVDENVPPELRRIAPRQAARDHPIASPDMRRMSKPRPAARRVEKEACVLDHRQIVATRYARPAKGDRAMRRSSPKPSSRLQVRARASERPNRCCADPLARARRRRCRSPLPNHKR